MKKRNRVGGAAAALAATLTFMAGIAFPAYADNTSDAEQPGDSLAHGVSPEEVAETEQFWTQERLDSATPLDSPVGTLGESHTPAGEEQAEVRQGEDIVSSEPVKPQSDVGDLAVGSYAGSGAGPNDQVKGPSTVGRLFFTTPKGSSSCTASAVAGGDGTKIITAGHCIHPGDGGTDWYKNFAFIPAYYKGSGPQGIWYGSRAVVFQGWKQGNYRYDQGFVSLGVKDGRTITQAVGGNGLIGGGSGTVSGSRIWGYPAETPFDGSLPYFCDGSSTARSADSVMQCRMNEGASGGPWIKDHGEQNLGYTWAVTSRCVGPGANSKSKCALTELLAAPNPRNILQLRDA